MFSCDLEALAPLLAREGAELGLVEGPPPSETWRPEGRSLVWHRPPDPQAAAACDLFATSEGGATALALRARTLARAAPPGGLFDSPARRHAFAAVAGALASGVLAMGVCLLALGTSAPVLTVLVVGAGVVGCALVATVLWAAAALWGRVREARAEARALRWRRATGARLFAALERGLRRAGPYR
ncbi:MAG TPA: hypothetical protein VFS00_17065 [Polyangiaceae bacterium]|nr:hypothetical protein [Polyangiaceae bacterium]